MAGGRSRKSVIGMAALCALFLAGCEAQERRGFAAGGIPLESFTAEQIFERGEYELDKKDAEQAAYYFGEIERLYPYSEWAKRALIMQAFAYHQDKDYENSRASAQRYIDFYPTADDASMIRSKRWAAIRG